MVYTTKLTLILEIHLLCGVQQRTVYLIKFVPRKESFTIL